MSQTLRQDTLSEYFDGESCAARLGKKARARDPISWASEVDQKTGRPVQVCAGPTARAIALYVEQTTRDRQYCVYGWSELSGSRRVGTYYLQEQAVGAGAAYVLLEEARRREREESDSAKPGDEE